MGFKKVRVTNVATKILGENSQRQSLILTNGSTSGIVYLGPDSTVASGNAGTVLDALGSLTEDSGGTRMYMSDVWGITTSAHGSADVFVWERTR